MLFLTVVAAGIVALTGFPVSQNLKASLQFVRYADLAASVRAAENAPLPGPAERLRESGSLALLASALFGASVVVNRRRSRH